MHYQEKDVTSILNKDKESGFVYSCVSLYCTLSFYAGRLFSMKLLVQGEKDMMDLLTSKQQPKTVNQRTY